MTEHSTSSTTLPSCCRPAPERKSKGFLMGIIYGLVPHTFCILFVVFSVVGATAASSLVKQVLYVPYFFNLLIGLSAIFATISVVFYLRRNGLLSWAGLRRKWRYITIMYTTTIAINLLFFQVVFPAVANLDLGGNKVSAGMLASEARVGSAFDALLATDNATLEVDIPCPGHAPLIIGELRKVAGVRKVKYRQPNLFQVSFSSAEVSLEEILKQEVFIYFAAEVRS